VHTNARAPRWQLVLIDPADPKPESWQVIIPEKAEVLQSVTIASNSLIAVYMKDASSKAYVHQMNGMLKHELQLPGLGTLAGISGEKTEETAFYAFTSFLYPTTIFSYEVDKNTSHVFKASDVDFKADDFETKQVFYTSKDGTKVPMFIVHKKGLEMKGENPCMLYGYGGFNISLTPGFSISRIPFLEQGGVYCIANIRGGGEYGDEWHKAGTRLQKQNVFDDFIAAAEYLIAEKYTSPGKLAISGGSNGGLLVGACMTQRPELFKVALPAVGVLDMLRYHRFTIGWAWATDYGSSDNEEEFKYLLKYSPYHNLVRGQKYPATLITTADHDDRVVPAHSFKFAARIQEFQHGNNPVMIRIDVKAGHGAGKPTAKQIDEATDVWSFTMHNLGMMPRF
jgi:prolyl oligopeptidase